MKNIVILHLESLSKLIYQMNKDVFVNLINFQKNCLYFNNYYSTATSTAMVMSDVTYGDLYRLENTQKFGEFKETHSKAQSFVDLLDSEGYHTLGIHYPEAIGDEINPGHMYAKNKNLVNYSNYERAINDVKKTIDHALEGKTPFLIYFCNEVSHLCYTDHKKHQISNPTERWKYGYKKIDDTVGDIIGLLKERNLLENTTIVLYGDHGDDFYCHDYNGGFAHTIEPYVNLIHTPFMIYDSTIKSGVIDDIICSLDVRQIVCNLIGVEVKEKNKHIHDRYHSNRQYVFSRNMYAGQMPKQIDACISNVRKAYAITTKEYSLILSDKGYRMYLHLMDPTCNNNLLDFFYYFGKKIRHIINIKYMHVHYRSYIGYGSIEEIQENFDKMKKWMKKEVSIMERETNIEEVVLHNGFGKIMYTKNMFYMFAKLRVKGIRREFRRMKNVVYSKMKRNT